MVAGTIVVPVVLVVSAFSFPIVHYTIISILRVLFSLILVRGKITGLC